MRKFLSFILVCLALNCTLANAQTKGVTFSYWTHAAMPLEKDGAYRMSFNVAGGYNFNDHISLQALITPDIALFAKGTPGTFESNILLGIGLSYVFKEKNGAGNEIIIAAANTVGAKSYKYNYFDIGYRMNSKGRMKLTYGMGVKYYNSQTAAYTNSTAIYVTIGVRFN